MKYTTIPLEPIPLSNNPNIESEIREFLISLAQKGWSGLSIAEAKHTVNLVQMESMFDMSGIDIFQKTIIKDDLVIDLDIVRPEGVFGLLPVFVFLQGPSSIFGDFVANKRLVRDLVVNSGAVGIFINDGLAQKLDYMGHVNQAYATIEWLAENGKEINVDAGRLALVGNGFGAGQAVQVSWLNHLRQGPAISLQVLMWPCVDTNFDWDSYRQFGKDYFLTSELMEQMIGQENINNNEESYRLLSPLGLSLEDLGSLPPTLIQLAEVDVLRDQGEEFGRKLNQAGVEVTTVRYVGMIHAFGLINALVNLPAAQSLIIQASGELRSYLFKT